MNNLTSVKSSLCHFKIEAMLITDQVNKKYFIGEEMTYGYLLLTKAETYFLIPELFIDYTHEAIRNEEIPLFKLHSVSLIKKDDEHLLAIFL